MTGANREGPHTYNPRMHQGGKLSFRRRVRETVAEAGDLLVLGGDDPPHLEELRPDGLTRVEIEIGSGKGAFLVAACAAKPDTFVLGIEAAAGYAGHAAAKLREAGLRNGLLLVDNGKLFLSDRVAPGELDAVHVYYPDPWPKRRHKGRRFFTDDVTAVLAHALRDGGWCCIATDNPAYAGQICRVMGRSNLFVRDEDEERRLQAMPPGHAFSPTNFERKYIVEGRILRRYAYRRVAR